MKAKNTKEFVIFGMLFSGDTMELYAMISTERQEYDLFLAQELKLPSTVLFYNKLNEAIELLILFVVGDQTMFYIIILFY